MRLLMYLFLATIALTQFRCTKAETRASQSLIGEWRVDSLMILYMSRSSTGSSTSTDSIWKSAGSLGIFIFNENKVNIDYQLRDTQIKTNPNYTLHSFKENAGFIKVRKWQLILPEKTYSLEFGDQTSDAHIKAKNITLLFEPPGTGNQQLEILHLSKN